MILGTAGHIDHGKTTLVRALTGVDTDRLPEEQRRGITIDLGFAPLQLDGLETVGVVDVPGHEAFVRTMVAGATGVDLALLVLAADEGVMPQTREHLAILSLLGVRAGVVALTKCDLVEQEWLELVEAEVRGALEGSPLADAPVVPVSAHTGAGLDSLREALCRAARSVPATPTEDLFRLPIDRAFTIRGTGTVVTGTVWSGLLARDATVRLLPSGDVVRVRGLHSHGRAVETVRAGERAAVALAGVAVERVHRGTVLVTGDAWRPSRLLRADVRLLPDAPRPLGSRSRVRLHLGTSERSARIVVSSGSLAPGEHASARVVLDEPLVARTGDRFVLRAESPAVTLGGGIVIDPFAPPRARPWPMADRTSAGLLDQLLADAGANGVRADELAIRLGVPPKSASALATPAGAWRVGELLVGCSARQALEAEAVRLLGAYHAEHPLEPGAPQQWLRSRLGAPEPVAAALLASLTARGTSVADGGAIRLSEFAPTLSGEEAELRERLVSAIVAAGREPPSLDELAPLLGASAESLAAVARLSAREGRLVAVETGRYYSPAVVDALLGELRAGMTAGVDYGPAELRLLLGVSRKFLLPFLEYCDRAGGTLRDVAGRRRWSGA